MGGLKLPSIVLEFKNISVSGILHNISLRLEDGEMALLLGPNGAGKTTLFRAALGSLRYIGLISIDQQNLGKLSSVKRAGKLACLPQDSPWLEPVTALDAVIAARFRFSETRPDSTKYALKSLKTAGAAAFAPRTMTSLSGGERQRVQMAIALAQDTPWLLLDEPANHLDPAQQQEISLLIRSLWQSGRSILAVVHDVNVLRWLGGANVRVIGLKEGRIAFDCQYSDPDLPAHLGQLFGVPFTSVEIEGQRLHLPKASP